MLSSTFKAELFRFGDRTVYGILWINALRLWVRNVFQNLQVIANIY